MKTILTLSALLTVGAFCQTETPEAAAEKVCDKTGKTACADGAGKCDDGKCCPSSKTLKVTIADFKDAEVSKKTSETVAAVGNTKMSVACAGSGCIAIKYKKDKVTEAELLKALADAGLQVTEQEVSYKVSGLVCGGCASSLSKTLAQTEGVVALEEISHADGKVVATIDPNKTSPEKIKAAINATKYKVAEAKAEMQEEKTPAKES